MDDTYNGGSTTGYPAHRNLRCGVGRGTDMSDILETAAGQERNKVRPRREIGKAHAGEQPFEYPLRRAFVEPDWTRLPGFRDVTEEQWRSAQWQRAHTVKNLVELKRVLGDILDDGLYADIERDQQERATMSMLIPPQMVNTMNVEDLRSDPVRRYMAPAFSDREVEFPSHPMASRDSLHEADMWAVEGLTHRYPTKVLAEMIPTCPQYCGHCTRMDLVGNDTLQVLKYKFEMKQQDRWDAMLDYLRRTPSVRDVVVSGGDVANVPIARLQEWLFKLFDIPNIRDVRLATKGLMGLPQHFLQDEVLEGYEAIATRARERDIDVAVHTHVNAAQQVTPLVGRAVRNLLDMGYRDVRNQGVLLRGVNTTPNQILELCFMLLDHE
jgi:lysine 2,3-aminomutase